MKISGRGTTPNSERAASMGSHTHVPPAGLAVRTYIWLRKRAGIADDEVWGSPLSPIFFWWFRRKTWEPVHPMRARYMTEVLGVPESDIRRQRDEWTRDATEVQLWTWRKFTISGLDEFQWQRQFHPLTWKGRR